MELTEKTKPISIEVECKEVSIKDTKNGRCYFFIYEFNEDIQCELEGKKYHLMQFFDEEHQVARQIRLNLYPSILEYFGEKRMPDHVFDYIKNLKEHWSELKLPKDVLFISPKKVYTKASVIGLPSTFLEAEISAPIVFEYNGEVISIECKDKITFVCL